MSKLLFSSADPLATFQQQDLYQPIYNLIVQRIHTVA